MKRGKRLDVPVSYETMGNCLIVIGIELGYYHLSISCRNRLPTYEEIKDARYKYCPNNCYMAQIFPPKEEFVNIHKYCIHLWEVD